MNKILTIALFLTFAMLEPALGQVGLHLASGINLSNAEFKNIESIDPASKLGYFIEIAPHYQSNEKIKLLLNFQYSNKGYKSNDNNNLTASEYRYSYLDIIPEIEYYIKEYLALGVGINYGVKLSEQFKFDNEDWSDAGDFETIKSTDFGLTGKFLLNYNNIFGFVRYTYGLIDISEVTFTDANGLEIDSAKQLSRNWQIGIGYTLNLK